MNKKFSVQSMCIAAAFMALTCIATMVIQIPIPLGYAHLGDSVILITTFLFGPVIGCLAGGIGSMMADILTGYTIWAIPTLIIKSIMPLICYKLHKTGRIMALLFMVAGYVVFGCILEGNVMAGLSSAPGLLFKAILNYAIFVVFSQALEKSGFKNYIKTTLSES